MVHIRPSIPEKCPHDQDQLSFPQSGTTSPTALSNHKRAGSIPCAGYRVHCPQAQRTNSHSWQLLRCSKHMAQASTNLQAHGMPHVSRVVKHVVLIVQNIGKLGGHGQAQAMRPNLQNVCAGQNFRPLTCI